MVRHFLQSRAWQEFQRSQGKLTFSDQSGGWSYMACLEASSSKLLKGQRLYAPYGPTATDVRQLAKAVAKLKALAADLKVQYVRLEAMGDFSPKQLRGLGLLPASRSTQPPQTWQLGLKDSEEQVLKAMSATNRNLWRAAQNKNLSFGISYDQNDLAIFLSMIHSMSRRTGMRPHSDQYFKTMAGCLFSAKQAGLAFGYLKSEPIVAALFFDDFETKTRYYAHAGSFDHARKLQANSPLLTYLILEAKKAGFSTFDFYGVAPADQPNHPWAGFSKFKRSFGGYDRKFNGTWELPVKKTQYKIINSSRKIIGKLK